MSRLESIRDAAAEQLARARPAGASRDGDLLWWEIRGRCRLEAERTPRLDVDGGLRVERVGPGARRESRAMVGFPARAARRVWTGDLAPRAEDRAAWRDAVRDVVAELRDEAARVFDAARERDAASSARRAEAHLRVRAWVRDGEAPRAVVESGVRLGGASDAGGSSRRIVWAGAWGDHPPAAGVDAVQPSLALGGELEPGALSSERRGPVTLLPGASSWWVHEMGHAAAETSERRLRPAPRRGLTIADDPTLAPWPHGFEYDDEGAPARRSVLWDDAGSRPLSQGHARRASLTAVCLPSMACTFLEGPAADAEEEPPCEGEVVADDAVQGRFDPSTGRIFLVVGTIGLWRDGCLHRAEGGAILEIGCDEGWRTVRVRGPGAAPPFRAALCTRLGAMSAVMVGAPTLTLDSVQLRPWNLPRDAAFPGAR